MASVEQDKPMAPRLSTLTLAVWSLMACTAATADSTPPRGSPSDVRYTSLDVVGVAPLYPRADTEAAPTVLRGASPYAANAAVARVVVEVDRDAVPADGQSPVQLTVRVYGADGAPLKQAVYATIEHSGGRILLDGAATDEAGPRGRDTDRAVPGVQLRIEGGSARFKLLAPAEAQDVRVRVSAGSQQAAGQISFVPELREMVAAGLVEGLIHFRRKASIAPLRRGDAFEQDLEQWSRQFSQGKGTAAARTAFYVKGLIRGDALLTAAYDSDKPTRTRLLRDIRPDEMYPVYGDASLRSFDARSADRLYVRIDKHKSYLLYGDFVTGDGFSQPLGQGAVAALRQRSLGAYNRSATGLRAHHESGRLAGNLFVVNDSLRQVVEEFASQGSGPYGLRHNGVLEGSEKVEVLVRDRAQPSRILSVRALARLVDYGFEPFSGRVLLASFLPSVDESLNPVSLRITYEVDQGGEAFWVAGGDVQFKLSEQVELGGSGVVDRNGLSPYELLSANATWRINERSAVVLEAARSQSSVNTNPANQTSTPALAARSGELSGSAWRVELAHEGERSELRAFAGRAAPQFNNPAAPLNGGRAEGHAKGAYRLSSAVKLVGELLSSEDLNPGGGERRAAAASLQWAVNKQLTLEAGIKHQAETVGTLGNGVVTTPFTLTNGLSSSLGTGAGGGALGYGTQALDPATGLPLITQGGLQPLASSLAAGTRLDSDTLRLGAGWRAGERLTLGGEVEHEMNGDARRRAAAGADLQVAERTKLYGRYERQSGWVTLGGLNDTGTRAEALVFGVDTRYLRDTQLFSEYRLRDALGGRDAVMASGVRQTWDYGPGIRLSGGFEHQHVLDGSSPRVMAVMGGVDYSASELWRASTKLELRRSGDTAATPTNDAFGTALWQGMVARKLDRDFTLLARNHLLLTKYAARGDVLQNRAQLGLAWRPVDTNRINALGKLEYRLERDASNALVGPLSSRAFIASAHTDYHPSRPWWFSGRVAAKWQTDRLELGTESRFIGGLVGGRMVYDITENWDIAALATVQLGQAGARQHALGFELGYLLKQNLWLSGGVNLVGFAGDRDLAGYEYTNQGVYVRLRFKFDETLFKGDDREVNRALPR